MTRPSKLPDRLLNKWAANNFMNQTMRVFNREIKFNWLATGLILLTALLSFGMSIANLGLYGDQWDAVLQSPLKPDGLFLGSAIQNGLIAVFRTNTGLYHLLNLVLFALDAFLFLSVLVKLGINSKLALASALLFMVFPAFGQPGAAYKLTANLTGLLYAFLSADLYLAGLQKTAPDWRKLAWGAGFAILAFLSTLEVAVFGSLFIFLVLLRKSVPFKKANLLIFLCGMAHMVIPLIILSTRNPNYQNLDTALVSKVVKTWLSSFILSWRQIIALPTGGGQIAAYLLILAVAAGLIVFVMTGKRRNQDATLQGDRISTNIWMLGAAFFLGIVFFLMLALFKIPISTEYPVDTGMVVIGSAAAVMVTATVAFLFMEEYQAVILAILIVLAAGTRYQVTREYVGETERVEDFLAQLQVRGDRIKPGTNLVVEQLPFDYTSHNSLEAMINSLYGYSQVEDIVRVIPADNPEVREFLSDSSQQTSELRIDTNMINMTKDMMLGVWVTSGACVEIIDADTNLTKIPEGLSMAGPFSNPELLEMSDLSDVKQLDRFRTTIRDEWCFYYQLASRFVRQSRWNKVVQLYAEAEKVQLHSDRVEEYTPLLSSLIHMNRLSDAVELSKQLNKNPDKQNSICKKWIQILSDDSLTEEVVLEAEKAQKSAGCE